MGGNQVAIWWEVSLAQKIKPRLRRRIKSQREYICHSIYDALCDQLITMRTTCSHAEHGQTPDCFHTAYGTGVYRLQRPMRILVINSGSSSMKFSVYETGVSNGNPDPKPLMQGELSGIGNAQTTLKLSREDDTTEAAKQPEKNADSPSAAARLILDLVVRSDSPKIDAIGYRVVHPGSKLVGHQRITPQVFAELERAISFAPLHDPAVLEVIKTAMERLPDIGHFACFDTEFHRTMPEEATIYEIPKQYRDAGVRRYGFHGLSCESILYQLRQHDDRLPSRIVIAHLGSGCSVTAVEEGRSIDTSMGLTPDGGVVMGTRPGDLDPGLVLYLLRQQQPALEEALGSVEIMLNHNSGMVAISGLENDMQLIRQAAVAGHQDAILSLRVFTRCIVKAIGGFACLLGGLDAIVFTGGIGEHDPATREEVSDGLRALHVSLDALKNDVKESRLRRVDASESQTAIFVIPAQEDLMIARHVAHMVDGLT